MAHFWELGYRYLLTFSFFSNDVVVKNGKLNGRPQYTKLGNKNMFLSYTNATNYPTPWTMWAGPTKKPGSHLGNIKIGPANTACPEGAKVVFQRFHSNIYV